MTDDTVSAPADNAVQTQFHYTRVRAGSDAFFYDPQTDIKQIVPTAAAIALHILEDTFPHEESPELHEDLLRIHQIYTIFSIKIAEDPQPLDKQIEDFNAALNKLTLESRVLWYQMFTNIMLLVYSVFARRDTKLDENQLTEIMEFVRMASYKEALTPETYEKVRRELTNYGVAKRMQNHVSLGGSIICEEDKNKNIDNCKTVVKRFVNVSGNTTWEGISKACDEVFSNESIECSDKERISLGLAYPSYEVPCTMLTGEDDGTGTKTDET